MWARIMELMLGVWLWVGIFVFDPDGANRDFVIQSGVAGASLIVVALLSYIPRLRKIHLVQILIGALLTVPAFVHAEAPSPPELQNLFVVGLLVAMLGVIPSRSSTPPLAWTEFYDRTAP